MKLAIQVALTIFFVVLAVPAFAGGGGGNCMLIGSWYGYDGSGNAWWMSTADGQNASHGTVNLEVPGSVHFFPGAVAVTELRGQWMRTSGKTYNWTVVGLAVDAAANTLFIGKLSGTDVFGDTCHSMWVTNVVLEVFPPSANIWIDEPMAIDDSFPDHQGFRVNVDLPEQLP